MTQVRPIAVDIAGNSVTLAFRYGRNQWFIDDYEFDDQRDMAQVLTMLHAERQANIVVIEKPYLGKNPKTFGILCRAAALVEVAASAALLPSVGILATEWQACMLLMRGEFNTKRADLKRRSILRAKAEGYDAGTNHDRADAVNLCVFASKDDRCQQAVNAWAEAHA